MTQQTLSPLTFSISPGDDAVTVAGELFKLRVTIGNQGKSNALIDVDIVQIKYIDRDWTIGQEYCVLPSAQRLALASGQSSEMLFEIDIRKNFPPGNCEYLLIIEAPEYDPPQLQHRGKIKVTPFVQSAHTDSDPTFTLEPSTNSLQPHLVKLGQKIDIKARVDNRSKLVDRFTLSCPDINLIWSTEGKDIIQVNYPEQFPGSGRLFINSPGLELNPGEKGVIFLQLTIPVNSIAGIYSPTIRIHSHNQQDLVLLDIFYLQVEAVYFLDVEMLTRVGTVHQQAGLFQVYFSNRGNTVRKLHLQIESNDQEELCTYTLEKAEIELSPGELQTVVNLTAQPSEIWWKRPFNEHLFSFIVEITDIQKLPLVNRRLQGTLTWKARPWWHSAILAFFILAIIIGIILLVWWLFFKPKPLPQIVEFYPQNIFYKEINHDVVRLNWQVSEPKKLKSIRLMGFSPDGTITSRPVVYDLSREIPIELKDFCKIDQVLNCQNVLTDARKAGSYNFEMTITYQQGKVEISKSMKTNKITIEPIPQPYIVALTPSRYIYEERPIIPNGQFNGQFNNNGILLNWEINNPEQIQKLTLIGKTPEGGVANPLNTYDFLTENPPAKLKDFCNTVTPEKLVCRNVPTNALKAGKYIFELGLLPKQNQDGQLIVKKTNLIKINSLTPQIVEFKLGGTKIPPECQGKETPAKCIVSMAPNQPIPLDLSWQVTGGSNLQVELLPSPGNVPQAGTMSYSLSPAPSKETFTLKVTNPDGIVVSRSVVIESLIIPSSPPVSQKHIRIPSVPNLPSTVPGKSSEQKPPRGLQEKPSVPNLLPIVPGKLSSNLPPTVPGKSSEQKPPRGLHKKPSVPNLPEDNSLPPGELPPESQ